MVFTYLNRIYIFFIIHRKHPNTATNIYGLYKHLIRPGTPARALTTLVAYAGTLFVAGTLLRSINAFQHPVTHISVTDRFLFLFLFTLHLHFINVTLNKVYLINKSNLFIFCVILP